MTRSEATGAKLDEAAMTLSGVPGVVDVSIQRHPIDGDARLEVVVGPEYDRVPPRVCRILAESDCGIHDVSVQGDPQHYIIVAV